MRKRIIPAPSEPAAPEPVPWLDLEATATVEVTSEDPAHPIDAALLPDRSPGWRAATPGPQTVRLIFDAPQDIRLVHLLFTEAQTSRTQEFVLRWSPADSGPMREFLRQQYNFTPGSSEVEDYIVALQAVKVIELEIKPCINDPTVHAQLTELRLR